ncbi:hypothetical protein BC629DRAFT_1723051 [Irpex lacteus]|nr:hypothetical protein BC629DRAFT_1723051 [Irpex lacteus]
MSLNETHKPHEHTPRTSSSGEEIDRPTTFQGGHHWKTTRPKRRTEHRAAGKGRGIEDDAHAECAWDRRMGSTPTERPAIKTVKGRPSFHSRRIDTFSELAASSKQEETHKIDRQRHGSYVKANYRTRNGEKHERYPIHERHNSKLRMSNQSTHSGDEEDDAIVCIEHGSRGRPIEVDGDDDDVEYLGYSLPGALPGGTYRTPHPVTGDWIPVVVAQPTEERWRRPRRYYGPDSEEESFPLPRPRPKPLEPLIRRQRPEGSHYMIIPPGAKFGPPDRATREKRRERRRTTDGTSATDTVSGQSTPSAGAGTSTTTRALDESTSDAEGSNETEEEEVLGELTRFGSAEGD